MMSITDLFPKFLLIAAASLMLAAGSAAQPPEELRRASEIYKKGIENYKQGRYDAAIADYTEYLKIRPTVAPAWYNRGLAYKQKADLAPLKEDFMRADADFTRAIELDAKDADFWLNRGFVRLRLIMTDFKKYVPLAAADFTQALKLKPDLSSAYTGRAQVYEESNRRAEAIADANKALRLNPKDFVALYTRGKVHTWNKNYAAARADLSRAIELYPDYGAAKSQLEFVNAELAKTRTAAAGKPSPISKAPAAKPPAVTKTPVVARPSVTEITTTEIGFGLADAAEKAGDYQKVIDSVNKTLPLIAMGSENVPAKDLESFVYLDLLRKRARAYLLLKRYTEAVDAHKQSMLAAMDNMNYFNEKANQAIKRDTGGSGAGAIMAGVQTTTSTIICRSSFEAANEFVNTIERERPKDLSMQISTGILMGSIREMCAISSHMDGSFKHSRIYGYMGASLKTEQLNSAIERYTEAINYSPIFRPAYVARAKAYRELGRIDLALADEKKASTLPVK